MNTSESQNAVPPPLPALEAKLQEVAEETGYAPETVAWVFTNVVARDPNAPPAGEGARRGLSAEALCEKLIRHANDCCPGELRFVLEANHIFCSEDVGEIVEGLIDKGLLVREEDDYLTDFDGLFEVEHLGAYLAAHGIRRKWLDWPRVRTRLSIALYAIGAGSVIAHSMGLMNVPYGWPGWAVILSGFVISRLRDVPSKSAIGTRLEANKT
jgi:uncharacterized repeat protein (TIGR04138 family)